MVTLNLPMVMSLDRALRSQYDLWVQRAPESYTQDKFFQERVPIIVTSLYGQNQPLGIDPTTERGNWHWDRDFSKIRFMTVALATHLW